MVGAEGLEGDAQLYGRVPVRGDELIVLELDDIPLLFRDGLGHGRQFPGLVGKKDGNRENPVPHDQAMLNDGGHGDDIHIPAREDAGHILSLFFQMGSRCHGKEAGVLDNHLVIFHHVEEGHNQFVVLNCDDVVDILLNIGEDVLTRGLDRRAVGNGVHRGQGRDLSGGKGRLHARRPGRLHAVDLDLRIQKLGQSRNTGRQAAAADGNEDNVHQRQVFKNFHGDGALTGRHSRVVKGMDKGIAMLLRKLQSLVTGLVINVPAENHVCPVGLRPVHLDEGSRRRHDNRGLDPVLLRSESHALGMIPGGGRNQALLPLLI